MSYGQFSSQIYFTSDELRFWLIFVNALNHLQTCFEKKAGQSSFAIGQNRTRNVSQTELK